jgi:hypothetical protein
VSGIRPPTREDGLDDQQIRAIRVAPNMLSPTAMRTTTTATRTLAAVLLAAAGATPACTPQVVVDVGRRLVPHQSGGYLAFSNDDRTLFWAPWVDAAGHTPLQATDVASGATHAVVDGFDSVESPTFAADGALLFFIDPGPPPGGATRLMRAPVANTRAGTPEPIAPNPFWQFVVSLAGDRVAVIDADTSELTAIDITTGAKTPLGKTAPVAFSPDGSRLLVQASDPSGGAHTYLLADPSTGALQDLAIPGSPALVTVIKWDGATPRLLIPSDKAAVLDLATGEEHPLPPGMVSIPAFSGDPAAPTHGYFFEGTCLGTWMPEPGVTLCAANQGFLHRVNLSTNATDVVARIEGNSAEIGVSRDGHLLATNLDLNNGVDDATIFVKTLAPSP